MTKTMKLLLLLLLPLLGFGQRRPNNQTVYGYWAEREVTPEELRRAKLFQALRPGWRYSLDSLHWHLQEIVGTAKDTYILPGESLAYTTKPANFMRFGKDGWADAPYTEPAPLTAERLDSLDAALRQVHGRHCAICDSTSRLFHKHTPTYRIMQLGSVMVPATKEDRIAQIELIETLLPQLKAALRNAMKTMDQCASAGCPVKLPDTEQRALFKD